MKSFLLALVICIGLISGIGQADNNLANENSDSVVLNTYHHGVGN